MTSTYSAYVEWFRVRAADTTGQGNETIYSPKQGQTTYLPMPTDVTAEHVDGSDTIRVVWEAPVLPAGASWTEFAIDEE